jgi:hypothetical protein
MCCYSQIFHGFPWSQSKFWAGTHAALPMVTLKILTYTNMALTFDFGLDHLIHEGYGWGRPTPRRKKVIVK